MAWNPASLPFHRYGDFHAYSVAEAVFVFVYVFINIGVGAYIIGARGLVDP